MADHARAVIIGGVGGTSIAYHLAELGWTDVVLVDRAEITYLPPDRPLGTRGEVEVFGDWIGFEVVREPPYDPTGERIRA